MSKFGKNKDNIHWHKLYVDIIRLHKLYADNIRLHKLYVDNKHCLNLENPITNKYKIVQTKIILFLPNLLTLVGANKIAIFVFISLKFGLLNRKLYVYF